MESPPQVIPVSTEARTEGGVRPDPVRLTAVIIVVTMGDLPNIHIGILSIWISFIFFKEREKSDLLLVLPGIMPAVLTEGDGVLYPGLIISDKVHRDVLPVVIVAAVHPQRVAASLEAVPEVPGQLEEVSTANYLVVDRSRRVEPGTQAVITVGGLVWVAVGLG